MHIGSTKVQVKKTNFDFLSPTQIDFLSQSLKMFTCRIIPFTIFLVGTKHPFCSNVFCKFGLIGFCSIVLQLNDANIPYLLSLFFFFFFFHNLFVSQQKAIITLHYYIAFITLNIFTIRTIKDQNCMNANIGNNGLLASFKHNVFKSFLAKKKTAMHLRL